MSVDSGLPYFRGPSDFWKLYRPFKYLELDFKEVVNPKFINKYP